MAIYNSGTDITGIHHMGNDITGIYHMGDKVWPSEVANGFFITHTKQTGFSIALTCSVYNLVTINWGDGSSTIVNNSTAKTHTYATAGTWTVTLSGDLTKITGIVSQTQQITGISLGADMLNVTNLRLNGNTFPVLDLSMCSKIMTLYAYTNSSLTSIAMPASVSTSGSRDIQIYSTSISSFTLPLGLTSCTYFYAYSNTNMTSLNVSSLTSCTTFYAYSNPALTSLSVNFSTCFNFRAYSNTNMTSLNVSSLTSCSYFYAYSNPALTSLSVSLTSSLDFRAYLNTNMTSLNVSSLTSCTYFYAYSNTNMTSLNVSSLTSCSYFYAYSNTNMTSLNVSSLTSCLDFYAYSNTNMTSLNVSSLTSCSYFYAYSNTALTSLAINFTSCTYFYAYSNTNMNSLNVSSLTSCANFHAYSNPALPSLNVSSLTSCAYFYAYSNPALAVPILVFSNITSIDMRNSSYTQIDIDSILANCVTISSSDASCTLSILSGNATPSAAGLADIATLRARGWRVK